MGKRADFVQAEGSEHLYAAFQSAKPRTPEIILSQPQRFFSLFLFTFLRNSHSTHRRVQNALTSFPDRSQFFFFRSTRATARRNKLPQRTKPVKRHLYLPIASEVPYFTHIPRSPLLFSPRGKCPITNRPLWPPQSWSSPLNHPLLPPPKTKSPRFSPQSLQARRLRLP